MIEKYQEDYAPTIPRIEKMKLIYSIVEELKSSGARFLKHDDPTDQYYEVDHQTCINKV